MTTYQESSHISRNQHRRCQEHLSVTHEMVNGHDAHDVCTTHPRSLTRHLMHHDYERPWQEQLWHQDTHDVPI